MKASQYKQRKCLEWLLDTTASADILSTYANNMMPTCIK